MVGCPVRQSVPGHEMSGGRIGPGEMAAMWEAACAEIIRHEKTLTELDSICGDGDHGATMSRAAKEIQKQLLETDKFPGRTVMRAADVFMASDGGASCALLGAVFFGVAQTCGEQTSLGADDFARAFDGGLGSVRRYTRAGAGDKTMMDALEPAVQALRDGASRGVEAALTEAALAAEQGARETKDMQARMGRAQHLGVRTVGHQDPGATTVALLFRGFARGVGDG